MSSNITLLASSQKVSDQDFKENQQKEKKKHEDSNPDTRFIFKQN